MALPTNRTTSTSIADHVADHNVLHEQHNDLEGHAEATTDVHGIADTSQLATNADVAAAVAGLVDSAPATLDTLNELAAALGDDESFATTVTTALAGKAATGHDHDVDYEAAGAVATHAADTTDVHGIADTSALALTSHTHSGTYVPVPAGAPTPGQILSATDDDPLTTDWIDAPSGGGGVPGEYGDGSDGAVNFDGSTTVLGLVPSGGVYTLTRDVFLADGSEVSGTATIKTANYRIFCKGTFTIGSTATVQNDGSAASGSTAGGSIASGTSRSTAAGSAGATGGGAGGATSQNSNGIGAAGGSGGAQSGAPATGGGGSGGTVTNSATASAPRSVGTALFAISGGASFVVWGGGGGGGGGNGAASSTGGGGGAGAGVLTLLAYNLVVNGTLRAAGGAGAAATGAGTGGGGGGGGGGGALIVVYHTKSGANSTFSAATNVPGGAAGAGQGVGRAGNAGSNGNVFEIVH